MVCYYVNIFKTNINFCLKIEIARNLGLDTLPEFYRNIPSGTLSTMFPFISGALMDEKGFPTLRVGGRKVVSKEAFIKWVTENTGK